jgi:hypothetical protein
VGIWLSVVVVEMLLRAVAGQGVQVGFVIVTVVVLAVFLLGWRVIAILLVRLMGRPRH